MADILSPETKSKRNGRRSKKLSTKVDLTPMVDLGFLLITFFVFTTSITKPTAMTLSLPDDSEKDSAITAEGKTISILLAANNTIFYYEGNNINTVYETNFSSDGLRAVLRNKKTAVQKKYGDGKETVVLIKPASSATYSNVVDALDEIRINTISRYVLMDATETETILLHK